MIKLLSILFDDPDFEKDLHRVLFVDFCPMVIGFFGTGIVCVIFAILYIGLSYIFNFSIF